ncbi:MAG: hypothetical protein PHG85_00060 [Candidatus Altiarchaeota archaeon]|nr:hypothetical protein [Candidatus Altiarchaeota archaeon]
MNARKLSIAFLAIAGLLLAACQIASAQTPCDESLPESISPDCQPGDCGVYCQREMPDGNDFCQNLPDFPPDAKCCDFLTCDASGDGTCVRSTLDDPMDPDADGGECIYSNSDDKSEFMCPEGWMHDINGDASCMAGEYEGSFKKSLCCCAPMKDTCNGKPPEYVPDYVDGFRGSVDPPSESGAGAGGTVWYVRLNVSKMGKLLGRGTMGFDVDHDPMPVSPDSFKSYIRAVKVCNDGTIECGEVTGITDDEVQFTYSASYCEDNAANRDRKTAIENDYVPYCARSSEEDEPKRYLVLMKVDRAYEDGTLPSEYLNLTVVDGVYSPIAVDDRELIDVRKDIAAAMDACRNTPQGCVNPVTGVGTPTDEGYYDYCMDYILVRACDLPYNVNVTNMCKNVRLQWTTTSTSYDAQIKDVGFNDCQWEAIDAGKLFDFPMVYITVLNKSRHGANLGLMYYYTTSMQSRGSTHMVNPSDLQRIRESNVYTLRDWNLKSAGRLLGCRTDSDAFWSDKCGPGNFTCSYGAALAASYEMGFQDSSLRNPLMSQKCGYFEWEQPDPSETPGMTADYFQFNDIDDEDDNGNPWKRGGWLSWFFGTDEEYDDKAFDFELGIPDRKHIVNESIESISSNVSASFVNHSTVHWKGFDYRLAFNLGCRPNTCWSTKFYLIPWGNSSDGTSSGCAGAVDYYTQGPWHGGTTYNYTMQNRIYNYTEYPKVTDWRSPAAWPLENTVNNPIIYWKLSPPRLIDYFDPAATDRYWFVSPKTTNWNAPKVEATRPAHQGDLKRNDEDPLYYHNPGGSTVVGDMWRIDPFNEGETRSELKYYRQFNKRMLWDMVFKVTPEFHIIPDFEAKDNLCAAETDNQGDMLGNGHGDCGWFDAKCISGHCDGTIWGEDFCCEDGTTWDTSAGCCQTCGVYQREIHHNDYCRYKIQNGNRWGNDCRCGKAEGGCRNNDECMPGLNCTANPYVHCFGGCGNWNKACCPADALLWNGIECVPAPGTPVIQKDATIYTRTRGNALSGVKERGGGPIWFHFAAGGNLPNETEAGGTYTATEYCQKFIGSGCDDGGWMSSDPDFGSYFNTQICPYAWDYMRDQGGIWDESKNLGNDRVREDVIVDDIWSQTGPNPDGATGCNVWTPQHYWCSNLEGCNCYPNYATLTGPGDWTNRIAPQSGENPYWVCDGALQNPDGKTPEPPESCGKSCRKLLMKPEYLSYPVLAWFDYMISENSGAGANGKMPAGPNVLPLEAPWNFLHVGASVLTHNLNDQTTSFQITMNYSALHTIIRQPLAQECFWYGCNAYQYCHWIDYYKLCDDGEFPMNGFYYKDCDSPCGECEVGTYPCCPSGYYPNGTCILWENCNYPLDLGTEVHNTPTGPIVVNCQVIYRWRGCIHCWGAWTHNPCAYPVSSEDPLGGFQQARPDALEEINDTSSVYAKPYGGHLETSRPLGNPGSHAFVNVYGFIDYNWGGSPSDADYRRYRVNGSLRIGSIDLRQNDLIGGFDMVVPDSTMVNFIAKDYPPIHELYILDSTISKEVITINSKMQDMLFLKPCKGGSEDYWHYMINPFKKYYYGTQGRIQEKNGKTRTFFMAIGEPYSWDVQLTCDDGTWFKDPSKEQVGLFRNFHEDEAKYWDLVGFYSQPKDLQESETSMGGKQASGSETFEFKKVAEEESAISSKIAFSPQTKLYTLNFSTQSIESEKFEDSILRIYSDFRHIEIHPFRTEDGQALSCGNDHITEAVGSVWKNVYMRHPVELDVEPVSETPTHICFRVTGTDQCDGSELRMGRYKLDFNFPYTQYSGIYSIGQIIRAPTCIEKRSRRITFNADYFGYGPASGQAGYQTSLKELEIEVAYKNFLDYLLENAWVIIVVFLALMSYRFFEARRMDFQDMWDEWKGKK